MYRALYYLVLSKKEKKKKAKDHALYLFIYLFIYLSTHVSKKQRLKHHMKNRPVVSISAVQLSIYFLSLCTKFKNSSIEAFGEDKSKKNCQ